ncbi:MAG: C10 family peptidase [Kiritimatiellae bacterium]|nr:C10 family peptidase [Kiritimatiellia bacterium]
MTFLRAIFAAGFAMLSFAAFSGEVTADQAVEEVLKWTQSHPKRGKVAQKGGHSRRRPSGEAKTYSVDGTNLFHLVSLEGGGFVAVSAESSGHPILGFSGSEEAPDLDEHSPLWALLAGDTAKRRGMDHRRAVRRKPAMKNKKLLSSSLKLLSASTNPITNDTLITDMRVEPLIKSKWNQSTVEGKNVYNYYTPEHMVCGCVATAMAQLMRYHQYPASPAITGKYTCYSNTVPVSLEMKGGVYNWANMPPTPDSSITDIQREAIGRICYDAGVAMHMEYASDGSGAIPAGIALVLTNVFGYANAQYYGVNGNTDDAIARAILSNLDAKCPVILGIVGNSGGHAIVADGYGYVDETLYCHLNMGWSGSDDYWYSLPTIQPSWPVAASFSSLIAIVYNVFPLGVGEIFSGRVCNPFGEPVNGAEVSAKIQYQSESKIVTVVTNLISSVNGIFAINPPSKNCKITIAAACDAYGWCSTNISAFTSASISPKGLYFIDGESAEGAAMGAASWATSVGNSWGNDLVVQPTNVVDAAISSFVLTNDVSFSSSPCYALDFSGTGAAWYTLEYAEALTNQVWNVYTNILIGVDGAESIPIPIDPDQSSRFYRVTPGR